MQNFDAHTHTHIHTHTHTHIYTHKCYNLIKIISQILSNNQYYSYDTAKKIYLIAKII